MRKSILGPLAIIAGLVTGLGTAISSLEGRGSAEVAGQTGWREWQLTPTASSATYALAHFLTTGVVPPPSSHARSFLRLRDDDGNVLRGDCTFIVEGEAPDARWWGLSLARADGSQKAGHPVIAADDVVVTADGVLRIAISRRPEPGNWLRPADDGTYSIYFTMSNPVQPEEMPKLPSVKRGDC
jgi:hypothetical protein